VLDEAAAGSLRENNHYQRRVPEQNVSPAAQAIATQDNNGNLQHPAPSKIPLLADKS
jgi:hypothetical protein